MGGRRATPVSRRHVSAEVGRHANGAFAMDGELDVRWIHGSADCATNSDPPLQAHAFDRDTYILRQNKCLNYEGPFLYLLFGRERALLLDTGAAPDSGDELPVRAAVDGIIGRWLGRTGLPAIDLV